MLNRDPKRVHITMLHGVSEKRFVGTIEKCIDMNFSKEEKEKYASNLKAFMACFHGGTSLKKFSTILFSTTLVEVFRSTAEEWHGKNCRLE